MHGMRPVARNDSRRFPVFKLLDKREPSADGPIERRHRSRKEKIRQKHRIGGAIRNNQIVVGMGGLLRFANERSAAEIKLKAMVTKRIRPLTIDGKEVHTVGLPIHWGYEGVTKPGFITNTLTPYVGDANSQTPEFKAFLVNIEKA